MIDLIILAAQAPLYLFCWRKVFKKIAYWYVVKQRPAGRTLTKVQLQPDWGDVGWGIAGATIASIFWPLVIMIIMLSKTSPAVVAERIGGKPPPEVKMAYLALLENQINELEAETGIDGPIKGEIV